MERSMGSNPRRRKTRAAVLACPISHFRGGVLIVTCPTGRDHRDVPVDAIIARIGAGHSVKAVVEQLCHFRHRPLKRTSVVNRK
jgi:hypothetical protein